MNNLYYFIRSIAQLFCCGERSWHAHIGTRDIDLVISRNFESDHFHCPKRPETVDVRIGIDAAGRRSIRDRIPLALVTVILSACNVTKCCQSTHTCIWIWPSDGLCGYFSYKQADVLIGVKTYDTTVYEVWKHVAWSKHVVKLWQYVEHPTGWMSFAWHSFDHHSKKDK